jgi:hypothetical protein
MPEPLAGESLVAEAETLGEGGPAVASRVRRTGIALVHEGEYILPAPGAEAGMDAGGGGTPREVHYHFPVELVIVGTLSDAEREAIESRIWEHLADALARTA